MGGAIQAIFVPQSASRYRFARCAAFATAVVTLGFGVLYIRLDSTTYDLWQHLAAIRYLSTDLLTPPPLFLDETYEVHLYTPYHLFWAAVMALGQLDIWEVLVASSIINFLLFILGCHLLARRVIGDESLDFVLFATLLLFWGAPPWWSGVYNLAQIVLVVSYPSTFAFSAAMIVGAVYFETRLRSLTLQACFAAVLAVLFLVHPITTSFLLLFLAVKVLTSQGIEIRSAIWAAWPAAVGILLGLLWPYFSVTELILAARSSPDFFGNFDVFYDDPLSQIGPAVLGIGALGLWRSSRPIRFLLTLLAVLLAIYAANYALQLSHIFSRYLIFIAFVLQLSLVAWLASLSAPKTRALALSLIFLIGISAGVFPSQAGSPRTYGPYWDLINGAPLGTHSAATRYRDLESLGPAMQVPHPTVMAPTAWAYPLGALLSVKVVALPYDAPTISDSELRRNDVTRFYNSMTSCEERTDILRRRKVNHVLVVLSETNGLAIGDCFRNEVGRGGRFVLYSTNQEGGW